MSDTKEKIQIDKKEKKGKDKDRQKRLATKKTDKLSPRYKAGANDRADDCKGCFQAFFHSDIYEKICPFMQAKKTTSVKDYECRFDD